MVAVLKGFRIASLYYGFTTGELEKENQTYELWEQSYPRDPFPHHDLAENYESFGQFDKAISEFQAALRLNYGALTAGNLCSVYTRLNRLDEAKAVLQEARKRELNHVSLEFCAYELAFFQNNASEMQRAVAWSVGRPTEEDVMLNTESATQAYFGRLQKAGQFTRRAIDSESRYAPKEVAANVRELIPFWTIICAHLPNWITGASMNKLLRLTLIALVFAIGRTDAQETKAATFQPVPELGYHVIPEASRVLFLGGRA